MTGLTLRDITIHRGPDRLLSIDTHIPPGEILTIMGPSGSGKSTLLAHLTGTLPSAFTATGRILLDGRDLTDLPTEARRLGLLFQDHLLFPHLSVAQNLGFGLRTRRDRARIIQDALAEIGLPDLGPRDPATLSGGQRARIALMRTLLSEPHALLLDEPFSRLDADRRARTRETTFARARAHGLPTLLVTHDAEDAQAAAGPVIHLD